MSLRAAQTVAKEDRSRAGERTYDRRAMPVIVLKAFYYLALPPQEILIHPGIVPALACNQRNA
jgi:hypothetical protein